MMDRNHRNNASEPVVSSWVFAYSGFHELTPRPPLCVSGHSYKKTIEGEKNQKPGYSMAHFPLIKGDVRRTEGISFHHTNHLIKRIPRSLLRGYLQRDPPRLRRVPPVKGDFSGADVSSPLIGEMSCSDRGVC